LSRHADPIAEDCQIAAEIGPLRSARLILRPLVAADANELFGVLDDPALHTFTGGSPLSHAALSERLARWETRRSPDGAEQWLNWTVIEAEGGAAIGYVQVTVAGTRAALAYVIGRSWQGRGFAQEACAAVVAWLELEGGVDDLVAHIHADHVASQRVVTSLGLTATAQHTEDGETVWQRPLG
jgi:RimJ/RimL family protein N-acetyltransferase